MNGECPRFLDGCFHGRKEPYEVICEILESEPRARELHSNHSNHEVKYGFDECSGLEVCEYSQKRLVAMASVLRLGCLIGDVFEDFDRKAVAAASIAQVEEMEKQIQQISAGGNV